MAGNPKGSDIMDLLRATIVVNSESQIQPTLELIKKKFPQVLRVKDRFTKPQDTGYRDILMNVKLPNGLAVEIQLNIPEMIKAKTSGHVLYAMSRNSFPYTHLTLPPKRKVECLGCTGAFTI